MNKCYHHGSSTIVALVLMVGIFLSGIPANVQAQMTIRFDPLAQSLPLAIRNNDIARVNSILDQGVEVNALLARDLTTALHLAVIHHQEEITALLLKRGANINAKASRILSPCSRDKTGRPILDYDPGATPLHIAAFHGSREIAEILLNNKADLEIENWVGFTPLQLILKYEHHTPWPRWDKMKTYLIEKGAKMDVFAAACMATTDKLKSALATDPHSARLVRNRGMTPLHYAAMLLHPDAVRLLLAHKADPNAMNIDKMTPLHMALFLAHMDLSLLQPNTDDPSQTDTSTALRDTVKALIDGGADINTRWTCMCGSYSVTPLGIAKSLFSPFNFDYSFYESELNRNRSKSRDFIPIHKETMSEIADIFAKLGADDKGNKFAKNLPYLPHEYPQIVARRSYPGSDVIPACLSRKTQ